MGLMGRMGLMGEMRAGSVRGNIECPMLNFECRSVLWSGGDGAVIMEGLSDRAGSDSDIQKGIDII